MKKEQSIGQKLRSLREQTGMGIKTVGREIDVSYTHISKVENGHRVPSAILLEKLAKAYGVEADVLLAQVGALPTDIQEILSLRGTEVFELLRQAFPEFQESQNKKK